MVAHRQFLYAKQFFYVRHGQTDWNLKRKLQGNADIPLNETGVSQAHEAKDLLKGQPIATICSSPLKRARKTADIINEVLDCPIIEIAGLKECNFGVHEGTKWNDWLQDWLKGDESTTPPGVESYTDFIERGRLAVNEALTHPGPVLIVAHGGIYMAINKMLGEKHQHVLANGQPVRHDPPNDQTAHWQVDHITTTT